MANFEILDLTKSDIWNTLLQKLPPEQQDIYFTPQYYSLYEQLGDGKAQCFVYEKDNELALYPFLLNSVNNLGYDLDKPYSDIQGAYGYNGITANSNRPEFISSFYREFDNYISQNNIIAEFTRFHPLLNNYRFSQQNMMVVFDRKTMFLSLENNYENIFKTFQTTTRKQIKRCSHKHHLEVEIVENNTTQIDTFYSIYQEAMDRVQSSKYLYFNTEYFKNLIQNTPSVLFIATLETKPIAAIIAFYNHTYLHGHLGGALTDYLYTSSYSLLYSEMIKFGIEKNCKYFHAGGGTTNHNDDPLLQFKLNFSATTADFYLGKKIHNMPIYEEVTKQWAKRYPEKAENYQHFILKYRY
ncbi:MAG: GNAT family N-acetyltransferase [Bacteroidota bacterium]